MTLAFGSSSYAERVELLRILARLNAQPFVNQVAQSPWDDLVDVPTLHAEAKERIRQMVERCERSGEIRIQTIIGQAGYGKTHLLAWLRQELEKAGRGVLIYVPPYRFGSPDAMSFEQHLLQSTYQSFWQRSPHREQLVRRIQRDLVDCYDNMVMSSHSKKEALGLAPGFFAGLLGFNLKIAGKSHEKQRKALQDALACSPFLDAIFAAFKNKHPIDADGVQYERDAFISVMLLACGNEKQLDVAERWFLSKATEEETKLCHLDGNCRSTNKVRDSLYTIRRLMGQPFYLTLDQLEDTYRSLPNTPDSSRIFGGTLGGIIRDLGVIPGFGVVFMFNVSVWQEFCQVADAWLVDRLTEGRGVYQLRPLDEAAAKDLIRVRMQRGVWDRLSDTAPPDHDGIFPFTNDVIQQILTKSNRELRTFLYEAQDGFEKLLKPEEAIEVVKVQPDEVWCDEETKIMIGFKNTPPSVRVFIEQKELPTSSRGQPGEIEVTIPCGLAGDVTLRIASVHQSVNAVEVPVRVRQLPRPLKQWVDGAKVQNRLDELGLQLKKTANQIGFPSYHKLKKLMAEELEDAPDELYEKLSVVLETPLHRLLKTAEPPVQNGDLMFAEPVQSEATS